MTAAPPAGRDPAAHRNEVVLVGRLAAPAGARTLATGVEAVTFRLDVALDPDAGGGRDSFDCTVTAARTRRAALGWNVGDTVEVSGIVRRRFYRAGSRSRAFTVVEARAARRLAGGAVRRRRRTG